MGPELARRTKTPARSHLAQIDYIAAYTDYVDMVYKTFKPFDYETGEGIVVAAPKEALLRPAVFSDEHLPGLGKIWAAQERLWIQRTLLEVVAEVNKNAKDWDTAIIRQIDSARSRQSRSPRISARSPRMKSSRKPKRSLHPVRPKTAADTAAPQRRPHGRR